ncbi:group I truncated hemoglobin [Streptomyces sp. NBC_01304]|uniref:group I truncated hemoglobin n=1 Tax=Streptomyces sp. NBC_01304 TaxID=2903818 RepID=UPI002E0F8D7F|nr:group 1 truncated hemoglobin [Streptomyces sp. NBC_01304]
MDKLSIFERIGGEPAVAAVVDVFYQRVLADEQLARYFADTDFAALKAHQRSFIGHALGATTSYDGRAMGDAHAELDITEGDFDRVVGHLAVALADCGVDQATIADIALALVPLKGAIVTG